MRILLLWFIKGYWLLIPPNKRNECLFKKSCSHYVFDTAKEDGLLKGIKAFRYRFKHCRQGYYIVNGKEGKLLVSSRNKIFDVNDIKNKILDNE